MGVDVGADRVHVVGLSADGRVIRTGVFDPSQMSDWHALLRSLGPDTPIAIDGPAGPSAAPFADDRSVSAKFRRARGCEVVLGRDYGIWVSFATGTEPLTGWMAVAEALHTTASCAGHVALEVYPHAVYRLLHGTRPPKKTTAEGIATRVSLLHAAGVSHEDLAMWSHDALDATAAALVALHYSRGVAQRAYCPDDDTSIWLPASASA